MLPFRFTRAYLKTVKPVLEESAVMECNYTNMNFIPDWW